METVGFIGVGSIGAPMAKRLGAAGYKLTVCDRKVEALEAFRDMGAKMCQKPADCADSEMVIVMVANDLQVKEVVTGPDGILSGVNPEGPPMLAIMSTVLPKTIRELAPECAKKGVAIVDAPVSGFPTRAEQGKLTIMVGGEEADLNAMRPVFEVMGENVYHTGVLGSGDVAKLINNIIGITNMFLSVEAMLIGKKCGMDLNKLAAIFETSSGRNFATKDWEKGRLVFEVFCRSLDMTKVVLDLSQKDLRHAQELAKDVGVVCPLLDNMIDTLSNFSYEEIKERWQSL